MARLEGLRALFNSLFWRLFSGLIAIILITGVLVWGAAYIMQSRAIERLEGTLDQRFWARRSIEAALAIEKFAGKDALVSFLQSPSNSIMPVFVMDKNGTELSGREVPERAKEILLSSSSGEPANAVSERLPNNAVRVVEIDGSPHFVFAARTEMKMPPIRMLLPIPFQGRFPAHAAVASILLLAFIVAWILASFYTKPLRRLDAAMRRFGAGDLSTRAVGRIGRAHTEVIALAERFDEAAAQIEKLINRQRTLFHNVSHEVRSPLARIEVALDLARLAPDRIPTSLDRIEKEVKEIDRLIESLLTYARIEGAVQLELEPIQVESLMEEICDAAAYEAQNRGIRITVENELPAGCSVPLNAGAMKSALMNVCSNALRHTPENGTITLGMRIKENWLHLTCTDEGPGVAPEELSSLFAPFVRGSKERTGTGFGLGLAIVKSSIEAQRGRVDVRNIEPHGLEFDLQVPLSEKDGGKSKPRTPKA